MSAKTVKNIVITAFLIILIIFCFWRYDDVFLLLKTLLLSLRPIIIGIGFAFLINSFAIKVMKFWRADKIPEKIAWIISSLIVYIAFIGIFSLALYFVIPSLIESVRQFFSDFDSYYKRFSETLKELPFLSFIEKLLPSAEKIRDYIPKAFSAFSDTLGGIAKVFADTLIGFAVSFYFVLGKESFKEGAKKLAMSFLPEKIYKKGEDLYSTSVKTFSGFLSGQLTDSFIMGILCFIGMAVLGFPYPLLISSIIGFTNIIPVFGPVMGTIPSAFILLFADPMSAVWFVVFILILQQIEAQLIYPRVVGTSVGLKPFWTLFAIIVGGNLFGIWGMIIGIPLLSVIQSEIMKHADTRKFGVFVEKCDK